MKQRELWSNTIVTDRRVILENLARLMRILATPAEQAKGEVK